MKNLFNYQFGRLDKLVLRISAIYLVFGIAWILITDSSLFKNTGSLEEYATFNTYKGLFYVVITTVFLYLLLWISLKRQIKAEHELSLSEERWKFALEGSGDCVWDWNIQTDHMYRSPRWHTMYGYGLNEIYQTSKACRELIHLEDIGEAVAKLNDCLSGKQTEFAAEYRVRCKDGTWKWTLCRGKVINRDKSGAPLRMIGTYTDFTERKLTEQRMMRLAHYDPLTETPNRVLFRQRLQRDVDKSKWTALSVVVLYLDLDKFKEVNDQLGHDNGDLLLQLVARRLEGCVTGTDTVARLSGDEFTIILNNIDEPETLDRIAARIIHDINSPFQLKECRVKISVSVGISIYPKDGEDPETLMSNADLALHAAKTSGGNTFKYFNKTMERPMQAGIIVN